jgi:hypothetical protein
MTYLLIVVGCVFMASGLWQYFLPINGEPSWLPVLNVGIGLGAWITAAFLRVCLGRR